ncbi:conserved hypothetical protein [Roseibium sp. TrichSKD4]|uniref:hypothetical protein n=1 Tax=Roseibium sp. TrichSKD4 TaxID=744980 RepID=UPI0001E56A61|nr:hypothetical protein [Roseibium sp. TrichSKD4]EFO32553.1 conserved hypothetical protein [Roseibium sp. TrichSKD4]
MLRMMDDFELRALRQEQRDYERAKWFIASKRREQEKEVREERAEQNVGDLAASLVIADPIEVKSFRADLDTYDVATIEAIMENREILERLYRERDLLLERAYKQDDGTRVFKSEDGVRVFDDHGNLVSPDRVDPDEIADHYPCAESYLEQLRLIEQHEAIDQNLIGYQTQLDDARDRLDSGELSQSEFDDLRSSIENNMPAEVRRKLPDYDPTQEAELKTDFSASATHTTKLSPADMAIDPSMVPGLG